MIFYSLYGQIPKKDWQIHWVMDKIGIHILLCIFSSWIAQDCISVKKLKRFGKVLLALERTLSPARADTRMSRAQAILSCARASHRKRKLYENKTSHARSNGYHPTLEMTTHEIKILIRKPLPNFLYPSNLSPTYFRRLKARTKVYILPFSLIQDWLLSNSKPYNQLRDPSSSPKLHQVVVLKIYRLWSSFHQLSEVDWFWRVFRGGWFKHSEGAWQVV